MKEPRGHTAVDAERSIPTKDTQNTSEELRSALLKWNVSPSKFCDDVGIQADISGSCMEILKQLVSICEWDEGSQALKEVLKAKNKRKKSSNQCRLASEDVKQALKNIRDSRISAKVVSDIGYTKANEEYVPAGFALKKAGTTKAQAGGQKGAALQTIARRKMTLINKPDNTMNEETTSLSPPKRQRLVKDSSLEKGPSESGSKAPDATETIEIGSDRDDDDSDPDERPLFSIDDSTLRDLQNPNSQLSDTVIYCILRILRQCSDIEFRDSLALDVRGGDPVTVDKKTIIPIYIHQNHWVLAVLDATRECVKVYDSLPSVENSSETEKRIHEFCRGSWAGDGEPEIVHTSPIRQNNDIDCGVAAIAIAVFEAAEVPIPDQLDFALWRRVILSLLVPLGQTVADLDHESGFQELPLAYPSKVEDVPGFIHKMNRRAKRQLLRKRGSPRNADIALKAIKALLSTNKPQSDYRDEVAARLCRVEALIEKSTSTWTSEDTSLFNFFKENEMNWQVYYSNLLYR